MGNDLAALVPAQVTVLFPATADGNLTTLETPVSVTLASLALPEYAGIVGAPWEEVLHRYELAQWIGAPNSGDWVNQATLTALAQQVAMDWYHWQLEKLDVQYIGAVPWNPDGLEDLDWRQGRGRIATRLLRGPWNPSEDLLYAAPALVDNSTVVNNIFITNQFTIYNQYTYETYLQYTINYVTNTSVINIYETVINFYGSWGNPVPVTLVTDVCFYPFTKQWTIGAKTTITAGGVTLITQTFTLAEPTTGIFFANIDWSAGTAADFYEAFLIVDGATQALVQTWTVTAGGEREMGTQGWVVPLSAGAHTVKLTAQLISGTGGGSANVNTNLILHTDGVLVTQYEYFLLPPGTLYYGQYCTINPEDCCPPSGSGGSGSGPACAECSPLYPIADQYVVSFMLLGCSGGGGGPGPIQTPCCPAGLPATLSVVLGGALSAFGTVVLTYNPVDGRWEATVASGATACNPSSVAAFTLSCSSLGALTLQVVIGGSVATATWLGHDCNSGDSAVFFRTTLPSCNGAFTAKLLYGNDTGGGLNLSGPITLNLAQNDCCWNGTSATVAGLSADLCLVTNGDGSTSWVLTVVYKGDVVAQYRFDNGTTPVDCCATVILGLEATSCTSAAPTATAAPIGCGSSASGSAPPEVVTSCCPGGLPATLYLTLNAGTGQGCSCINGTYPMTWSNTLGGWTTGTLTLCGKSQVWTLACQYGSLGPCNTPPDIWMLQVESLDNDTTAYACGALDCSDPNATFELPTAILDICQNTGRPLPPPIFAVVTD